MARPTDYSEQLAGAICERIAEGESVRAISKDPDMPAMSTIFKWLTIHPMFAEQYARARDEQAETLADEITFIADTEEDVQRARVRIDARKWVAGKLKPKKYGEKIQQEVTGKDGGPIEAKTEVITRPPITRDEWLRLHGLETAEGAAASGA